MATGREGLGVDKRALTAMWLLPPAYVLVYRLLAELATKVVVALDSSVYSQGLSIVIGIACAIASALACVHVHRRAVGPLPVGRAFVMAAFAIPVLMLVHFYSMGIGAYSMFLMQTPLNALARYTIVFLALPLVAATWRPSARREHAYEGEVLGEAETAVAPPSAGLVLLRVFIALVSAVTFVGYGLLYLFVWGMSGFGMGRSNSGVIAVAGLPLPLLAFCFLSTTGLFGPGVLRVARPVVAVLTVPTLWFLVANGKEGLWAAVPVAGFVALWWLMCLRMEARA